MLSDSSRESMIAGVPTVIIDSRLESDSIVSFVATDNRKGGQLGAARLGELLGGKGRSEEHTSELQSRSDLVCRLLLEKKKNQGMQSRYSPSRASRRSNPARAR